MWRLGTDTSEIKKRTGSMFLLIAVTSMLFLYNWIADATLKAHVMPAVKKRALWELVGRSVDSPEEVYLLAQQTGLSEKVILKMLGEKRGAEFQRLQEIYFAPISVESIRTTPITVSEWLAEEPIDGCGGMPLVDVEDGDILITKNSRFLGWRNGHAGLVVDAKNGLVLEALMLGSPSKLCSMKRWEKYPSFQVLRLREEAVTDGKGVLCGQQEVYLPSQIASFAAENLVDIPYHLLADVLKSSKDDESAIPAGTHCAHLVWYAYSRFGIDLDSDGGMIVTPSDIAKSPYLEVVQSYGY